MHIRLPGNKVQLANAYATSHMIFGCVIWGHCFGMQLHLRGAGGNSSSVWKLEALYRASLSWAVAAPKSMHGAFIYLLAAMLPLHGLTIKATVRYFGGLECNKHRFIEATDTQYHVLRPSHWAADFVRAVVEELTTMQQANSASNRRNPRPSQSALEGHI